MSTTLLVGGVVHSPADPFATALLVEDGVVAWVGTDGAADTHRDAVDEVVELDGALVTPAFVDAHVHTTSTGLALDGLDLSGTSSLTDALEQVERFATRGPAEGGAGTGVVLGHGWDETRWPERRAPTTAELDRAAHDRPLYLTRVDVHSAVASSALRAVVPDLPALPGYEAEAPLRRDAHHAARATAHARVTASQRDAARRATRARAAAVGIGCLHELGGPQVSSADDLAEVLALAQAEPGPEVIGYWGELGGVERARELGAHGAAGDLFADGALGSRTACLRTVYADAPGTSGHCYLTAAQVRDHVVACTEAGVQAGFHVIGDGALDTVLAGLGEAAAGVGEGPLRAARHRLEHVEMPDAAHLAELARLGVFASVQPVFDELWGGPDAMYAERLGPRAAAMNPFADMARAGIPLALGSDSPVTPLGPWRAVRAAAFHHTPAARLTVRGAFAAHTRGGWRAAGVDDAGILAPGAPATFAVWARSDLVVQTPDERVASWSTDPRAGVPGLPDLSPDRDLPECLRTVVRGQVVYTRDGAFG